jgi:hypothetical protein
VIPAKNKESSSRTQPLPSTSRTQPPHGDALLSRRSSRIGAGGRSGAGRRRRSAAGQNAIAAVGLLVDADVVGEAAEEVELDFDPAEDLVGWGEDFEVAETDLREKREGWLLSVFVYVGVVLGGGDGRVRRKVRGRKCSGGNVREGRTYRGSPSRSRRGDRENWPTE